MNMNFTRAPHSSARAGFGTITQIILALFLLFQAAAARAASTADTLNFIHSTWEITELSDDILSHTLDTSYSGVPYKDWIDFLIHAPDFLGPLVNGDYDTAASAAYDYAQTAAFTELISSCGLTGVAAPAQLAVWPIEQGLNAFAEAVAHASFKKQCQFYFAARSAGDSPEAILNAADYDLLDADRDILITSDLLTKYGGWLCVTTSYLVGGPPGLTPAQFFNCAERLWQARNRAAFDAASVQIAAQFRRDADPCAGTTISPLSRTHGAGAVSGSVTVTAASGCAWVATASAGWITITSGGSGSGNGTVNYAVSANASTATRNGTIAVAGKIFAITQAGATPVTGDMVLIPAGNFEMGNCMEPSEGLTDELPAHNVALSSFYMDRFLVTKALWDDIYQWAIAHGYDFDNAGLGKAPNHPVHTVSWYDMVKWCNARSEKAGLPPAYYTSETQESVYRTGHTDVQNSWVKWSSGYRAPTEAEWERAARGGGSGHRFPWTGTDSIMHSLANYEARIYYFYDVSYPAGFHPAFFAGNAPYTSPVGSFEQNAYGLYDMAGNVFQWCWDWYDGSWYTDVGATQTNTHGPGGTLNYRMMRGGNWGNPASLARCAFRNSTFGPSYASYGIGFRSVLPGPEDSPPQGSDKTDGLVAYYPFDGNANDASGNGNHGIVNATTVTADRFGNLQSALLFNGSSSSVEVANIFAMQNEQTVTVWVKPAARIAYQPIVEKAVPGYGGEVDFQMRFENDGTVGWLVVREDGHGSTGIFAAAFSHTVPPVGQWSFITCVIDQANDQVRVYVNGVLDGVGSMGGASCSEQESAISDWKASWATGDP